MTMNSDLEALKAEAVAEDQPPAPADSPAAENETPAVPVELPSAVSVEAINLALGVALKRWPSLALEPEELAALAQAWQVPVNMFYVKLLTWLGQDPAKLGPWANALTVTAAVFLPRILSAVYQKADKNAPPA